MYQNYVNSSQCLEFTSNEIDVNSRLLDSWYLAGEGLPGFRCFIFSSIDNIAQHHAAHFNTFCVKFLNPFLNFHRPCLFSTDVPDPDKPGRIKRMYRPKDAMTPLDKLASLPDAATFLREGITLEDLRQRACALTDLQAAEELNEARAALFRRVVKRTG